MKHLLIVALLILIAKPAAAQINWPHNDFDAGLMLQRDFSGGEEQYVSDDAGGYWITYILYGSGDTDSLCIQHVDRNGRWLFPETSTIRTIGIRAVTPFGLIRDGSGGIVLFYYVWNEVLARSVLTAQKINAAGQYLWGTNGKVINDNIGLITHFALHPLLSMGNVYVSWSSLDSADQNMMNVKTQRIDGSGNRLWDLNGVKTAPQSWALPSSVAVQTAEDGSGGVAMIFEHGDTLFWQQINSSGTKKYANPPRVNLFTKVSEHSVSDLIYNTNEWYFAFDDVRYGNNNGSDIFLQKILPSTSSTNITQPWRVDTGQVICKYPGKQSEIRLTKDGQGGLIIAWKDSRNIVQQGKDQVFAQRWASSDAPVWTANGVQVSSNYFSTLISFKDPIPHKNGFIFPLWEKEVGITAQKMNMNGSPQWFAPLGKIHASKNVSLAAALPLDNDNICIVYRDAIEKSVRAKLLDKHGYLGINAPLMADVKDVINDQGGKLSVMFTASWQELNPPSNQFGNNYFYRIYRGISGSNVPEGTPIVSPETQTLQTKGALIDLSTASSSGEPIFWEQVSEIAPIGKEGYSKIVSSTSDSGRQGIPWNYFMTSYGNFSNYPQVVWYSNIDSGYSVDNLPPFPPQAAAGSMVAGAVQLHWKKNFEEDFAEYEIYRSTVSGFIPNEQNLLAKTVDTLYRDGSVQSNTTQYYIIKAVDVNGNRSDNSTQISLMVTDVSGGESSLPTAYALDQNYPNPFNPTTTIAYSVPVSGHVTMRIFDALGRVVDTPVDRIHHAGRYSVQFSGANRASGFYLCEIRAEGFVRRIKMNLLK